MRYSPEQKTETRKRILAAAERSFRKGGYSGVGVDGLAKAAGVTSGAFYGHFKSKEAAFEEAVASGLDEVVQAIKGLKEEHGDSWWTAFAHFYTNQKRTCDLTEGCSLQALTPEVGRSSENIRAIFESELLKVADAADGEPVSQEKRDETWARLAMLVGGVTLARAVKSEELSSEIGAAVENAVVASQSSRP